MREKWIRTAAVCTLLAALILEAAFGGSAGRNAGAQTGQEQQTLSGDSQARGRDSLNEQGGRQDGQQSRSEPSGQDSQDGQQSRNEPSGQDSQNGRQDQNGQQSQDEVVTLDWYVDYSWFYASWGGNQVSKAITERTGVSVNFLSPVGNEEGTVEAMLSSGQLPDLITLEPGSENYQRLITEGRVYDLVTLARLYDEEFFEVARQEALNWYRQSDGAVYGYPNCSITPTEAEEHGDIASNQTFLVRKDIYEALGSPDMTTPEGFCDAVRRAAELFPETEDGQTLIPVGGTEFTEMGCDSFDHYLKNFLAIPYAQGDEYYDRTMDEEYLRWLRVFRQLREEGYLKNDIFVDTRTQISEKLEQGRYFCLFYQRTDFVEQQKVRYKNNPDSVYIAVDGPKNSKGDDPVLPINGVQGWTVTMITKNCKNPTKAIRFLTFLMSEEGQKLAYLGVEGKSYTMADGEVVFNAAAEELLEHDRDRYNEIYGGDFLYWMMEDVILTLQWQRPLKEPGKQTAEWTYPYAAYVGQYDTYIPENTPLRRKYLQLRRLWGQTLRQLLLAESEEAFDGILGEFREKREQIGFAEVAAELSSQIRENKRKIHLE